MAATADAIGGRIDDVRIENAENGRRTRFEPSRAFERGEPSAERRYKRWLRALGINSGKYTYRVQLKYDTEERLEEADELGEKLEIAGADTAAVNAAKRNLRHARRMFEDGELQLCSRYYVAGEEKLLVAAYELDQHRRKMNHPRPAVSEFDMKTMRYWRMAHFYREDLSPQDRTFVDRLLSKPRRETTFDEWRQLANAALLTHLSNLSKDVDGSLTNDKLVRHLILFTAFLGGTIATILLLNQLVPVPFGGAPGGVTPTSFLLWILAFGVLGAVVSGVISKREEQVKMNLRGSRTNIWFDFARISLGAASALIVYVLVQAGIFASPGLGEGVMLSVAFAAGFSEKLLVRAIEPLVTEKKASE